MPNTKIFRLIVALAIAFALINATAGEEGAAAASPIRETDARGIFPAYFDIPESLTGCVNVRVARIREVLERELGGVIGSDAFWGMVQTEEFCGVPPVNLHSVCLGMRTSDGTRAILVSTREPVQFSDVIANLALPASKPARLGHWQQCTLKMGGRPALLAVQTAAQSLLLVRTATPHLETPASLTALMKDMAAVRALVGNSPALVWGGMKKTRHDQPFTGGWLPELDDLIIKAGWPQFDVRWEKDLEFRFAVPGGKATGVNFVKEFQDLVSAASSEGLQHPPQVTGGPQGNGVVARVPFPKGFFGEMMQVIYDGSARAKSKRNAQYLASTSAAARAAGCDTLKDVSDLKQLVGLLREGVSPAEGQFKNLKFQVTLTDTEAEAAMQWLRLRDFDLEYVSSSKMVPEAGKKSLLFQLVGRLLASLKSDSPAEGIRHEAENVRSTFMAGRAAGSNALAAARSVDEVLNILSQGTNGSETFASSTFQCGPYSPPQIAAIRNYLTMKPDGTLEFDDHGESALRQNMAARRNPKAYAKRDAQNLASCYGAARAAGAGALNDIDSIINAFDKGVRGSGNFSSSIFRYELSPARASAAKAFLKLEDDILHYVPKE